MSHTAAVIASRLLELVNAPELAPARIANAETSPRRAWCVANNHPGVVYNPIHDLTVCACAEVWTAGDRVTHQAKNELRALTAWAGCTHTTLTREHLDACCAEGVDCDRCAKLITWERLGLTVDEVLARPDDALLCAACVEYVATHEDHDDAQCWAER